ncbi:MAG: hypothetical protein GY835_02920 [bacterium]|nr:hypothetical protein [bacterium]
MSVYDTHGKPRKLGHELGRGGQGVVFSLEASNDFVVKLFSARTLRERRYLKDKIDVQISMETLQRARHLAWPQIPIFDDNGQWRGYAMKMIRGATLSRLAHPKLYEKYFPGFNRIDIVTILLDLLLAIDTLHRNKVYVGDLNLDNVICDPTSRSVYMIDTDSYQIEANGRVFQCPVGRPEMTPVEHHGKDLQDVRRTAESDLFSLAVLMFQCLMIGRHPFDNIGGGSPIENLRNAFFPYGKGSPRPGSPGAIPLGSWYTIWSHLTYRVKQLFIQVFRDGVRDPSKRPSIRDWGDALNKYQHAMEVGFNESRIRPAKPKNVSDLRWM